MSSRSEAVDGCICFTRKIEHGGDWERSRPQGPENDHNFFNDCATSELSMWAWNWNFTDSKKNIFDLITLRYFPIWQSKEMSHDFVQGQSVADTCFSHFGYRLKRVQRLFYFLALKKWGQTSNLYNFRQSRSRFIILVYTIGFVLQNFVRNGCLDSAHFFLIRNNPCIYWHFYTNKFDLSPGLHVFVPNNFLSAIEMD